MRLFIFVFFIALTSPFNCFAQLWTIDTMTTMPTAISNNAVCEGFIGNDAYVYSFAGIGAARNYTAINLKAFRYDVGANTWDTLPDLPDTLGKVAAAASRIGDIIYIIGGYHVFANGNEISSNRVHRYDIINNNYLSDGAPIPVPIDDQVQTVWRDSLIYIITGWSNTTNVPNVQIYNPSMDSWTTGTAVPNNNTFKSFGASGTIVGDTIYYFGGASLGFNFPTQRFLRKGVIDPTQPDQIQWSSTLLDNSLQGYRMAATTSYNRAIWVGGSAITFNYNGIAYNGSGAVPPNGLSLHFDPSTSDWQTETGYAFPMDLRGIGQLNDSTFILAGGMQTGPNTTAQTLRLRLNPSLLLTHSPIANPAEATTIVLSPNPIVKGEQLQVSQPFDGYHIWSLDGRILASGAAGRSIPIELRHGGWYILRLEQAGKMIHQLFRVLE